MLGNMVAKNEMTHANHRTENGEGFGALKCKKQMMTNPHFFPKTRNTKHKKPITGNTKGGEKTFQ